jgi:hypothetical protein
MLEGAVLAALRRARLAALRGKDGLAALKMWCTAFVEASSTRDLLGAVTELRKTSCMLLT